MGRLDDAFSSPGWWEVPLALAGALGGGQGPSLFRGCLNPAVRRFLPHLLGLFALCSGLLLL